MIKRTNVLDSLENGWGTYVERFQRLSPVEQAAFLHRQGYARLADLLAHVIAWWQDGQEVISRCLADPDYRQGHRDVDRINARAVESVSGQDEGSVIAAFEMERVQLIEFVRALPDTAFADERIQTKLENEITGHLEEHAIG